MYRRLILDLCHGAADGRTIRAAAEFARLLGIDLHCVYIQDEALFALADLPPAREIRLPSHQWSKIDAGQIEAELHQATTQARRSMEDAVRSIGIPNVFEVLRGDPAACIAAFSCASDIIAVAEPGAPSARAAQTFARLHHASHDCAASVLLLPTGLVPRHGTIVAVLTSVADPCLTLAARIAVTAKEDLLILIPNQTGAANQAGRLASGATGRAAAMGVPPDRVTTRAIGGMRADDVLYSLSGAHERLVVLTRGACAAGDETEAARIAAARGVPVLLVEPQEPDEQRPDDRP